LIKGVENIEKIKQLLIIETTNKQGNETMPVTRETINFRQFKNMADQLEKVGAILEKENLGDQTVTIAKTPKGKKIFKAIVHDRDIVHASWIEGLFDKTKG